MTIGHTDRSKKALTKAIRDWRAILKRDKSFEKKQPEELKADVARGDYCAVKIAPVSLGILAHYYSIDGAMKVLDGEPGGWRQIDLALMHHYWYVKFAAAVALMQTCPDYPEKFNPANTLSAEMPLIPALLCYAVVHDLNTERNEHWQLFQAVLSNADALTPNYWDSIREGKYELFAFRLFANMSWGGRAVLPLVHRHRPIDPYDRVLASWDDADSLAHALTDICDYHCSNLFPTSPDDVRPFETPPFDLIPYEILAIYKLRAQQGLETPEIDHPLMKLPTASRAPREVHKIDDPIFAKIEALFHKHCQPFWNDTLGL